MRVSHLSFAALLALCVLGCGGRKEHPAKGGHDDHDGEAEGARFVEGKGIDLLEETSKAIGLELEEAHERKLTAKIRIEARIYRTAGEPARPAAEQPEFAYATAYVNSAAAEQLKPGDSAVLKIGDSEFPARLWRVDTSSNAAIGSSEAILEIPDPKKLLRVGDFASGSVTLSGGTSEIIAIPRSAVLETIAGTFVFVRNGDYLLRTPVTTGAGNDGHIEITDGLYAGDIVANNPVETLYLIELRATKGGGHCH